MKIHPQIISREGSPLFAVIPYHEYEHLLSLLEDREDMEAIEASKTDLNEHFPLDMIEKIAGGKNPIKVFREYRRITQIELAKQVGVSRQYISQVERNQRLGNMKLFKKIAQILAVDLEDIT
jgi:DNA-binding XRE family transcriptional regulator